MSKRMANKTNMDEVSLFEQEVSSTEDRTNYDIDNENAIEFLRNDKVATVTFSQGKFISKVRKLAEKYPDKVQIVYENKTSVVAHVPVSAIHLSITTRELTEEQRRALAENARKALAQRRERNK
mgnify:FL=1